MTADLYRLHTGTSAVEDVLADLLDREWLLQNGRTGPLAVTAPVREGIELAAACTPWGFVAVASDLRDPALSPADLIARVRDRLPSELAPWTVRALRRVATLRDSQPLLPAPSPTGVPALPRPQPAACGSPTADEPVELEAPASRAAALLAVAAALRRRWGRRR